MHDEAENRLYDHGCELVEAAAGLARGAADADAARAVPALLGCIETALGELRRACAVLEQDLGDARSADHLRHGYANLIVALDDAEAAAHAARRLAARRPGAARAPAV